MKNWRDPGAENRQGWHRCGILPPVENVNRNRLDDHGNDDSNGDESGDLDWLRVNNPATRSCGQGDKPKRNEQNDDIAERG